MSQKTFTVRVPYGLDQDPLDKEPLTEVAAAGAIRENAKLFHDVFSAIAQNREWRADVDPESMDIEGLHLDGSSGSVSLSCPFSVYEGCKDQDWESEVEEYWDFLIESGHLVFTIDVHFRDEPDDY